MKDFIKWLGVNEKIAKVVVWIFIIMVMLIIINTALESLGFANYQITYDNLVKINKHEINEVISTTLMCILNFYIVMLLVFRIKDAKNLFKYSILYVILNWIISNYFGYLAVQIFIIIYCLIITYLYSNKNKKYILYWILAYVIDIAVQAIIYYFKLSFIDVTTISRTTRALLSIDYFIIMGIIILVKEIYLKKRGEK